MEAIIQPIIDIFSGADAHNWPQVQQAMADQVLLDYSSLSGSPAATVPSAQIVDAWKNFLPGFDKTHHQLFNFRLQEAEGRADVQFDGRADHYIGSDRWTVEGNYEAIVTNHNGQWQVNYLKFSLQKQDGNTSLPATAMERMKKVIE